MLAKNLTFRSTVAAKYSEKCPELSRIMMLEPLTKTHEENIKDLRERFCEHCATPFTATNSTFRLKSKHKRKKRKDKDKHNEKQPLEHCGQQGSNYLEILCKYCGWKTRHVGTTGNRKKSRDNEESWKPDNGNPQTPCSRKTTPKHSQKLSRSPMTPYSGKRRSKPKSTLKALLDKEKQQSKDNVPSPSLLNFLATV